MGLKTHTHTLDENETNGQLKTKFLGANSQLPPYCTQSNLHIIIDVMFLNKSRNRSCLLISSNFHFIQNAVQML